MPRTTGQVARYGLKVIDSDGDCCASDLEGATESHEDPDANQVSFGREGREDSG